MQSMHIEGMAKTKRKPVDKLRHVQVRLSTRLYMALDHLRGPISRQKWIEAQIEFANERAR